MEIGQAISWIFLATAIAADQEPADVESICQIADGINHAVPTPKELKDTLDWLINAKLIEEQEKKYTLTISGIETIKKVKDRTDNAILDICNALTLEIDKTDA